MEAGGGGESGCKKRIVTGERGLNLPIEKEGSYGSQFSIVITPEKKASMSEWHQLYRQTRGVNA